jgi:Sulfatase-modifying factor enzyme 1
VLNMAGNVAEWVSDWYDPRFYGRPEATVPDPTGPVSGTEKVVRGGSWDAMPFFSRSVHRQSHDPLQPAAWIGFRCAQDNNAIQPGSSGPIGAGSANPGTTDLALPTQQTVPGGSEENTANSAPTLPPSPTRAGTPPTLNPGG